MNSTPKTSEQHKTTMEEDWDEDLFEDGTVAWARPWDRPWWPAVLFSSWDAARNWTPPAGRTKIRVLGRPEPLQDHEALGYLLGDGSLQVFDKRTYEVQDWDYISPEAVLATTLSNRACDSSDDESDGDEERDPLRRAFVNAVEEARLALPLCGRAPDAARRFVDNTPRRGRWPAKKKSRVKKSDRRMNLCGNIAWTFVSLHAVEPTRLRRQRRVDGVESPRCRADAATDFSPSRRWRGAPKI